MTIEEEIEHIKSEIEYIKEHYIRIPVPGGCNSDIRSVLYHIQKYIKSLTEDTDEINRKFTEHERVHNIERFTQDRSIFGAIKSLFSK